MITLIVLIILFASVAMLMPQGMWSAAIALVNVTTAALLAINFWEPLAGWLEGLGGAGRRATYMIDFVVIWLLFAVALSLLRLVTDIISKFKVRFLRPMDVAGGAFFGLWTGWVLVCFVMFTFHTAPLSRNFLWGSFDPEARMVAGRAPDRQMLGFMQSVSLGVYSRGTAGAHIFDPNGEFPLKYASRRKEYETTIGLLVPAAPKTGQ